jgi:hypothetical protein
MVEKKEEEKNQGEVTVDSGIHANEETVVK